MLHKMKSEKQANLSKTSEATQIICTPHIQTRHRSRGLSGTSPRRIDLTLHLPPPIAVKPLQILQAPPAVLSQVQVVTQDRVIACLVVPAPRGSFETRTVGFGCDKRTKDRSWSCLLYIQHLDKSRCSSSTHFLTEEFSGNIHDLTILTWSDLRGPWKLGSIVMIRAIREKILMIYV